MMADTHMFHDDLVVPDGDILIHAGDMCRAGTMVELAAAYAFLNRFPHRHKIIVAGNHDRAFENDADAARKLFHNMIYLQDDSYEVEGIQFYGSPWTPAFNNWAFNLPRGAPLGAKWAQIPASTDVLITHCPPYGIGDNTELPGHEGCRELYARVKEVSPTLHVFGHVHQNRGHWVDGTTTFINVTTDECLQPVTVIQYPIV
jgi:Icc-related predicted phosphoesterase